MNTSSPTHFLWLLALTMTLGCSEKETVEVAGSVSWDGTPMPHGDIVFFSIDPHIPAAAGKIVEGEYAFECKPGEKRVEIQSYRLSGKKTPGGKPIGEMYVPASYNATSTLKADVTIDGENEFNFDLKP